MSPVVVDASVALKWVVAEEHSDRAEALYLAAVGQGSPIIAPPHLRSEVANALYRRSLRSEHSISTMEASSALGVFMRFPIRSVQLEDMYQRAFWFAAEQKLPSIYDALYVVVAQILGAEMWTADQRLLRGIGVSAPWVRWIGDYPLGEALSSS